MALKPVNKTLPIVSGTALVNSRLTTTKGTWANRPVSYRYKWVKSAPVQLDVVPVTHGGVPVTHGGVPVTHGGAPTPSPMVKIGTNSNSFLLTVSERGFMVGCIVTAVNARGSASAASKMLGIII